MTGCQDETKCSGWGSGSTPTCSLPSQSVGTGSQAGYISLAIADGRDEADGSLTRNIYTDSMRQSFVEKKDSEWEMVHKVRFDHCSLVKMHEENRVLLSYRRANMETHGSGSSY